MKYNSTNQPLQCFMRQSTCFKGTSKMAVKGVLWHSTGVNNPWLKRYVQPDDNAMERSKMIALLGKNAYNNDWNHIYHEAGLNCWIGKLANGTVATVQTMPWDYRPWGCGSGNKGSCNNGWIQFEICEDSLTDKKYFDAVYKEACEITAYLCKLYNIDPNGTVNYNGIKVPTILCHNDSYKLGLGSGHADVYHWFKNFGYDMTNVRKDVTALINESQTPYDSSSSRTNTNKTTVFKTGDVVKITGTKYYSGSTVPKSILERNWIVHSVKGTRVVVNKSEDGQYAIMSPFKASDLAHVNITNSDVIETGDIVKIIGTKYYSGAVIPSLIKNQNWIVHSAREGSDRIVINKSADGKYAIMSPVKRSDLAVVKKH